MFSFKNIADQINSYSKRNNIGPIGLELSLEKIHLVQLQKDPSGKIHYRAKASLPYSCSRNELLASPETLKSLLKKMFKSAPFSGKNIVTVMPAYDVKIISATYQVSKEQTEDSAIHKLMTQRIQGNLDNYVIDYLPVRGKKADQERLAIIAYAKRDRIINYLESMRKAGLKVDEMEVGPSAIKRLIGAISTGDSNDNSLVINFGRTKSYMTLISGERLLFDQEIEFGEEILLAQLSILLNISLDMSRELISKHGLHINSDIESIATTELGVDFSKSLNQILKPMFMKLADEINRTLIYTASETQGESVRHVYLLGSLARWQGADKMLNHLVNIPVSVPNPNLIFGSDDEVESKEDIDKIPEIVIASGLALRGFERKRDYKA